MTFENREPQDIKMPLSEAQLKEFKGKVDERLLKSKLDRYTLDEITNERIVIREGLIEAARKFGKEIEAIKASIDVYSEHQNSQLENLSSDRLASYVIKLRTNLENLQSILKEINLAIENSTTYDKRVENILHDLALDEDAKKVG
jgi:hypothetical protein